jgi:hypothetical protein
MISYVSEEIEQEQEITGIHWYQHRENPLHFKELGEVSGYFQMLESSIHDHLEIHPPKTGYE